MDKKQMAGTAAMAAAPEAPAISAAMAARESKEREKLLKTQQREEDERLKSLRDGGRAIGGGGSGSSGSSELGGLTLIFWLAAFIQLFDIILGTQRPGFILSAYSILIIISLIFVFRREKTDEIGLVIAAAIAYFLPWVTKMSFIVNAASSNNFALALSGLIILIPVVPLYIAFKFPDHTGIKKWARLVFTFWIIVFVLFVMVTYMPNQNTKSLINNPMAGVKYVLSGVGTTFSKTGATITDSFKRAIAQATGQPYEGSEESQVGIYVEDVKPLESKYSNVSDVIVTAKIRSANVKEPVNVNVICYIEGLKQGTTNPTVLTGVIGNYDNIVECRLGKLATGSYNVIVRANFQFESTSDITYTFVNSNLKIDQYEKIGINPQTVATYTGGPVELGLPSLTQPLRIDTNADNTQASSYPFGVSLVNKWPQGKIVKGLNYVLDTPKEVKLVDCSRKPVNSEEPNVNAQRNRYNFSIDTNNAQEVFDAVRCMMKFDDTNSLLGIDLKSVKTFAASAKYEYAVEGSTYLLIEKS